MFTRNRTERVASGRHLAMVSCAALVAIVLAAPAAHAQSASSQYDPTLDTAGIVQSGSQNNGVKGANAGGANGGSAGQQAEGATSSGKSLPFTGYPLNDLVAIVTLLLAAGLAVRLLVPVLDRRHS